MPSREVIIYNSYLRFFHWAGNWVTQEEAYKWAETSKPNVAQSSTSQPKTSGGGGPVSSIKGGPAPGVVVTKTLNPMRAVKGAPSALAANKRKREDTKKTKVVTKEDEAALRAREAARKRVEDREKPLMGLYKTYWGVDVPQAPECRAAWYGWDAIGRIVLKNAGEAAYVRSVKQPIKSCSIGLPFPWNM